MKVALYIYTESLENTSEYIVNNFKGRVIADGGVFEADSCCIDVVQSLGGSFDTYTTAKRIELYDDEKISITSSIQNVNDISKVFTDYSQSFVIPASARNNEIFRHWYENSLDNAFDHRIKYKGFIEIDTQIFRTGQWQLESASVKDNRIENYKITFFGELKSLLDKFGEDKLKDVEEINDYTTAYSDNNVRSLVSSAVQQNVMFPLITSDRFWQYGGASINDISTSGGAINYKELFPALSVSKIFNSIAAKYNLNFNGDFLNTQKFSKAYLWLKSNDSKNFVSTTQRKQILLADYDSFANTIFKIENNAYKLLNTSRILIQTSPSVYGDLPIFTIVINFPSTIESKLYVYKGDALYYTLEYNTNQIIQGFDRSNGVGDFTFFIESFTPTTYTYNYQIKVRRTAVFGGYINYPVVSLGSGSESLNSNLNLLNYVPDMKVSDFFSGILKMFNLTAFSDDGINFTLEQLENWYYLGGIKDFSGYCTTDFEYNRIKPYKKVNFEYQKSENILSRNFFTTNSREYGNANETFNSDGPDYSIKLPFENLLFNKFTGTNLQVGYALNSSLNSYTPKPIILYLTEIAFDTLYFETDSTVTNISAFNIFGQDCIDTVDLTRNTLNWGTEISSYFLEPINNSLFKNYYLAYLNNLYSLKSRMVKVKMRLPYNELLSLKLNDRIVIRDKRYIINQYTTDLTTFESDFELIQDFRSINFDNSALRIINNQAIIFDVYITSKELLSWSIDYDPDSVIVGISYNENIVKIDVSANTSGLERTASIVSDKNDLITIIQDA